MHRNKSVMQHSFGTIPTANLQRAAFDRTHGHKTAFDAGLLIPFFVDEALPGDTFNLNATCFARLATPIFPIMDNMFLDTQFFSVPYRLVWDNWERFNGAQDNPGDSTDFTIPEMTAPAGGYSENSIYDYMGLPVGIAGFKHSALFLRAYNLIYNQWYRDENLQNSITVRKTDGGDLTADYTIRRRGKRADYFTKCLPWPQKGAGVTIPLGTSAPVKGFFQTSNATGGEIANINVASGATALNLSSAATTSHPIHATGASGALYADLSQATSATINSLRQAFAVQKVFERDARGGTRYVEYLKAHWNVTSPDFRLQRPEFLGGGSTPVNISPIPQTSGSPSTNGYTPTPQGNLAAYGTALAHNHGFTHSFTEHCLVIGIVSVRADLTYQQGLNRMWSRKTRFDFALPALTHIGEQAVLNKEIFCDGTAADDVVFGYQERFSEYRFKPSIITGIMRSSAASSLDAWHLSQDFATRPVLDTTFIVENPPIDRCIAVPSEPHFIFDSYFRFRTVRPLPLYGDPGYIDRF